jgi:hypothetical protein
MDIGGWLRSLGLEKYEAASRENEIGETVPGGGAARRACRAASHGPARRGRDLDERSAPHSQGLMSRADPSSAHGVQNGSPIRMAPNSPLAAEELSFQVVEQLQQIAGLRAATMQQVTVRSSGSGNTPIGVSIS